VSVLTLHTRALVLSWAAPGDPLSQFEKDLLAEIQTRRTDLGRAVLITDEERLVIEGALQALESAFLNLVVADLDGMGRMLTRVEAQTGGPA